MYSSCTSESNFGRSRIEICSYRYTVQPGPIFSSIFSMHFSFFLAKVCVMYTTPKLGLSQNMVFYDKIRYLFIVYFPVSKGFHLEIRKIRTQIPDWGICGQSGPGRRPKFSQFSGKYAVRTRQDSSPRTTSSEIPISSEVAMNSLNMHMQLNLGVEGVILF